MKRALVASVLAGLVVLALISGGGAQAAGQTVEVTLDEWTLTADRATVAAGTVTFDTRNAGSADHDLLVVRTELDADDLGDPRYAGVYVVGRPHDHFSEALGQRSRHIPSQRSRRDVVDLAPGRYVLFCSLPGHRAKGQRTALTVTGRP